MIYNNYNQGLPYFPDVLRLVFVDPDFGTYVKYMSDIRINGCRVPIIETHQISKSDDRNSELVAFSNYMYNGWRVYHMYKEIPKEELLKIIGIDEDTLTCTELERVTTGLRNII